jgi:hypothetical protein
VNGLPSELSLSHGAPYLTGRRAVWITSINLITFAKNLVLTYSAAGRPGVRGAALAPILLLLTFVRGGGRLCARHARIASSLSRSRSSASSGSRCIDASVPPCHQKELIVVITPFVWMDATACVHAKKYSTRPKGGIVQDTCPTDYGLNQPQNRPLCSEPLHL